MDNDLMVELVKQLGVYGAIIYIIITRVLKLLDNFDKKSTNTHEKLLEKIESISTQTRDRIELLDDRLDKIEKMTMHLIGDSDGNVGQQKALSTFGFIIDKIHLELLVFYMNRCRVNHFIRDKDAIRRMYVEKANNVTHKTMGQLSKYAFRGTPLSAFFGEASVKQHYNSLCSQLVDLQELYALGDPLLNDVELRNAFDRILSKLMGMFAIWLKDSDQSYHILRDKYNISLREEPDDPDMFDSNT